ncbi:hypothetical protein LO763_07565 [Glycomyces sp. A-F 0318]|uniref:hypothetical protein n=1 Tax=Glycomyces amatae TaxID=2881355 RepID=UPI001E45F6E7|nr:hypothetical protein [Glycomyces amatae]MCD0443483.1 hypothetical protein [Glycomyces amatae]
MRTPSGDPTFFTRPRGGAPRDVSESAVELFFPLDEATAAVFGEAAAGGETDGIAGAESARPPGPGD